jgi:branched-chain amino acid aminotransferase
MGVSPVGAKVHVAIAAWPWGAYLGEEGLKKGIRVKTSSYARHHVNVTMARAKVATTYANSILANLEATQHGYDEGLLLDTDGFVAEGAGREHLHREGRARVHARAHHGAGRHHLALGAVDLRRPRHRGREDAPHARRHLHLRRGVLHRHRAEVTPIRELDRRVIGIGLARPVTERIQSAFFDIVNGATASTTTGSPRRDQNVAAVRA